MKLKKTAFLLAFGTVVLSSCGGWSEDDQKNFLDMCEKKSERAYCDCVMEKLMAEFDRYEDITEDQGAVAEILTNEECLKLDAKEDNE
ncbi:MAG: hypothetical protein H6599_11300 [Flavobacteriales bacterium]|nr:hypothetical protein [Flavobacteriales bacterium]